MLEHRRRDIGKILSPLWRSNGEHLRQFLLDLTDRAAARRLKFVNGSHHTTIETMETCLQIGPRRPV